jgi:CRISPR-associated protein Csm5
MNSYDIFDASLRLLTPAHIGNGRLLLNKFDYAIHDKRTWRLNENELLDLQSADGLDQATIDKLMAAEPEQLLRKEDFVPGSRLFRYVIQGTPRAGGSGAQLREQIKTPFDGVYIPGSTLKGALRTALAWHGWEAEQLRPEANMLVRRAEFAGQRFEGALFGDSPNTSLLRALQVGDSDAAASDALMVLNVSVLKGNGQLGAPVEMEALQAGSRFKTRIKIDRALFTTWARKRDLSLRHEDWLLQLAEITHRHARERIASELRWYQERGVDKPLEVYKELNSVVDQARPGQCLIQLGWGAGWGSKTFGSRLQADGRFMERIITDYRMSRGRRRTGDAFPSSRRVSVAYQRDLQGDWREQARYPLGWAWLTLKKRGDNA